MLLALPELQCAFHAATRTGEAAVLHELIVGGRLSPEARLDIYRNNTINNLCNALKADYPVVVRLVGDEFFTHAAKTYIAGTPSASGDINDYGESFPEFLAAFPPAAGLPYLGDVARLERAWKQAFYSAEAETENFSALADMPVQHLAGLRFRLHPSLRLIASPYPVLRIWMSNQPTESCASEICLDDGAECVLLHRVGGRVEMALTTPAEYKWLAILLAGRSLGEAVEAAFSVDEVFELEPCLYRHIGQGSFIGYTSGGSK